MGVCLVTSGKSHYSGLCDFGAITHYTTTVAYAHLRVNGSLFRVSTNFTVVLRVNNSLVHCVQPASSWPHNSLS